MNNYKKILLIFLSITFSTPEIGLASNNAIIDAQKCNSLLKKADYKSVNICYQKLIAEPGIDKNGLFYIQLLGNLGNGLILEKKYNDAIDVLNKAISIATNKGYSHLLPAMLGNISIAYLHLMQYEKSYNIIKKISTLNINNNTIKAQIHLQTIDSLSRILNDSTLDRKEIAQKILQHTHAILVDNSLPPEFTTQALIKKADLYQFNKQYLDAVTLLQKALNNAQKHRLARQIFNTQWKLAILFKQINQYEKSIDYYAMAIQELNNSNIAPSLNTNNSLNTNPVSNVYIEYADILLNSTQNIKNKDVKQVYLQTARQAIESSKAAQLQDFFKDQCIANTRQKFKKIDSIISTDNAVLYPILFDDRLELLLSTNGRIIQHTKNIKKYKIENLVLDLRKNLEKRKSTSYLKYSKKLYNLIVRPIEKNLDEYSISTLITIPGQGLNGLPFSALHDGKQFLIEKYALATSPGLKLTDPRVPPYSEDNVLLSGVAEPVQGYPALRYVENELNMINSHYNSRILIDDQFSSNAFSNALLKNKLTIAHIATHGEFGNNVQQSFILAYDRKIYVNELAEYIGYNRFRDTPLELLTLSACYTAAGNETAALGLAGITVKSGARSVLATLWPVNDRATAILMDNFYGSLKNNKGKAQSLRLAQLKLINDIKYRHPGYWSPFILIGNWQ